MIKKIATVFSVFVGIFAGIFVADSAFAYQITVQTQGDTVIEPQNGQVKTKTNQLAVQTDCRQGYTLQIQGPADTNLYLAGDAANNEVDKFIRPVNTASPLSSQLNTYGYNLISNQTNQIFTPLTNTAVTLKDLAQTQNPSANIDDTTNIYWGVNVGLGLNAGTYKMPNNGAATYIITTSPTCVNYYNISFDPNGGSGAQMPTQQITENTPTTLTKNTYTSSNDQDGFIGWNTQPDGSGTHYTDEQEVTLSGSNQNITLYAQWNCPASKICYFDNGASSPTTMDNQSASSNTATTLWPTNFQRKGYGFAGWAETPTPTTTDIIYGPQQTLAAAQTGDLTTKGKKLYAVWIEAKDTIQNWTGCPKLTQATYLNGTVTANLSSVTALLDTRDGEAYTVAKLPDGNCWMIENLRLGSNTTITLTPNDTSINANLTFPASTTSFSNSYNTINSIRQNAINKLNTVANMTGTNANIYSYGVYYTWPAAIGSTSAYSSGSVSTSICPRGWTLPLGNTTSSGSFGALDVSIGGTGSNQNVSSAVFNRWRSYPNNFVYSGGYYTSRYSYRGSGAVYWTRTLYGESYGFNLLIDTGSSRILPGDAHDTKYNGETIRCIARSDYYTITFDKNGGTGTMPDQAIYRNTSTTLNPATFTAPEAWQVFLGWNTKPDGTGTSYANEQEVTNLTTAGQSITLYAQWGCPPGNICYDKNGAANSPTSMGKQSVGDSDTSALLWPSNFQRSGYGFAGWNTKADGTGTMYGPNETIFDDTTINNIKTDGLALYATWIKSAGDIQSWDGCATMNIGDVTALTDKRDNQTYAVAKLADGKCWMTENLRLDNQYTTSAEDVALSQGYGTGFIGLAEPESSNFDYSTASNSLYSAADVNNNNTQMPRYNNINTANAVETLTSWTGTENIYSLGNYYTWTAIVANVDKVLIRNVSLSSISICPAGWRLPRGGDKNNQTNNDVWDLIVNHFNNGVQPSNYDNTDQPIYLNEGEELIKIMTKYPNNFVYSGRYEKDSPNNRSTIGSFWTSTFYSEYGNAYNFGMVSFSKSVNPGTSSASKFTGMPARCVVDERYTVSFDANGGSGDMADQSIQVGIATKLSANTFTNTEPFVGWNTKPDGTGDSYTNEQEVTDLTTAGETITLYAQWGYPRYLIHYDSNGAENSPTTMSDQGVVVNTTSVMLRVSNFQREGYGFAGWNTKADGTGISYGPNEVVDLPDIHIKGLYLYANWIPSAGNLQNWNGCNSMNIGDVTALTDIRDNEVYAVAKLADNKCWTIENLRLDDSAEITRENTDNPILPLVNVYNGTTSNHLSPTSDDWCLSNDAQLGVHCYDQSKLNTSNTANPITVWGGGTAKIYSRGNYYNWYSATAGNGTSAITTNNTSVSGSICPAGWRLPKGGGVANATNSDYWQLSLSIMGFAPQNNFYYQGTETNVSGKTAMDALRDYPNNFHENGDWQTNSEKNSAYTMLYTSTAANENAAYIFTLNPALKRLYPGTSNYAKSSGTAVRCIARENYTVKFDANGGSGDMPDQTIYTDVATKLSANTFTNNPKVFTGWNTKNDGTGDSYANEQEVTDLVGKGETITLYAQWAEPTPLEQISTMQEMTPGICSATPVGTEAVLKDTRDGKTYSVAKLKDGNCWMIENLDHDIDATKTYTPADTDISSDWTPDVSTINIQGLNVGESVAGWVGAFGDNGLASADPGEAYWDGSTNRHSRIGNYYNWTAALAVNDSGAYSNGTETDPSQNPQTSICPKGWRLPIIANEITGHVDEFKELNRLYNNGVNSTDSGLIASPLYFTRGGAIDQGSELQGVGDAGSYWSSTAGGPMYVFNTAYYFNHNASYNDSYSSNIAFGHNIRCVAR